MSVWKRFCTKIGRRTRRSGKPGRREILGTLGSLPVPAVPFFLPPR